jgi:hypothetical protein
MEAFEPLSDCEVRRGSDQTGCRTHLKVRPAPAPHDRPALSVLSHSVVLLKKRSALGRHLLIRRDQTTQSDHVSLAAQQMDAAVDHRDI